MSLDVYLTIPGAQVPVEQNQIFIRESGQTKPISHAEWHARYGDREPITVHYDHDTTDVVYTDNITHNLGTMARHAGLYGVLWEPETCGIVLAQDLRGPLRIGIYTLGQEASYFRQSEPVGGWGKYDDLLAFVVRYLCACDQYPEALVSVSR